MTCGKEGITVAVQSTELGIFEVIEQEIEHRW